MKKEIISFLTAIYKITIMIINIVGLPVTICMGIIYGVFKGIEVWSRNVNENPYRAWEWNKKE